jgi:hypothetical protein
MPLRASHETFSLPARNDTHTRPTSFRIETITAMAKKAKPSLYSIHPSIAYASAVIANFPKNTGKPIEAWV